MTLRLPIRFLLSLFLLFGGGIQVHSQVFTGKWEGNLTQGEGGIAGEYVLRLELTQYGNRVEGHSHIHIKDNPDYFGEMRFAGTIKGREVHFSESFIDKQNIPDTWEWCLKSGVLVVDTSHADTWTLSGHWEGTGIYVTCVPGLIFLTRPAPQKLEKAPREVVAQHHLKVRRRRVFVELWDSDYVDGDIVSLEFNGKRVVENLTLTKTHRRFELWVEPGRSNKLILYAENLGRRPPNTAAVLVTDGDKEWRIVLKSDEEISGAVQFILDE